MKVINVVTLSEMCQAALDGEPVFIFRAKDKLALPKLEEYHRAVMEIPDAFNAGRVGAAIERFKAWQEANPEKMKFPG